MCAYWDTRQMTVYELYERTFLQNGRFVDTYVGRCSSKEASWEYQERYYNRYGILLVEKEVVLLAWWPTAQGCPRM